MPNSSSHSTMVPCYQKALLLSGPRVMLPDTPGSTVSTGFVYISREWVAIPIRGAASAYRLGLASNPPAVEIGAEATVDARETWQSAQSHLYTELGDQLKALWSNGHKTADSQEAEAQTQNGNECPQQQPEHWCEKREVEYRKYTKGKQTWYPQKAPGGAWCREKQSTQTL